MGKVIQLEGGNSVEMVGDTDVKVKRGGALLGKGGQGAVYMVKTSRGEKRALKTYLAPMSRQFIDNLRQNIMNGPPSDNFIWPQALSEGLGAKKDRYGYVMDLFPAEYTPFLKILKGQENFVSKEMQLSALIELIEAFEALHAKGYSYQDLNDGGVMFDCKHGKVLICDCDNVAPSGVNIPVDDENHVIQGKFKYMAPEVAINMFKPDVHSDRFSLAVLIYMVLTHSHPLEGVKRFSEPMTKALQAKIYGNSPVFVFHPTDKSNRPDPEFDKNAIMSWPMIPDFMQNLFIKTFTSGMPKIGERRDVLDTERQTRTTEREWKLAIQRWMNNSCECPVCKHAICPDIDEATYQIKPMVCPHCKKKVEVKLPVMVIKRKDKVHSTIILDDGKVVPKTSVTKEKVNEPAFIVKRSVKRADIFGVENHLSYQWKCTQAGAKDKLVNSGEIFPALKGVHIEFDYDFSGDIYYHL